MQIRFCTAIFGSIVLAPMILLAQAITGSVSGSVRDASGSAVTNAAVTLTNALTEAVRTATTNDQGDFVFNSVPPGEYRFQAQAAGFKTFERREIHLTASERLSLGDLVLEVGAQAEKVTVMAEPAVVQTTSSERSSIINSDQMLGLLNLGRSPLAVLTLTPG